jgi:hypothetical protein
MSKIAIIICYFGSPPWYLEYFLKSCSYNATVDFILVTDIPSPPLTPANVKFYKSEISDIKSRAVTAFGFPVALTDPYKLCDLKPAYGLLFSDIISEYDFWGYSDIDVIYGNLRKFLTEELLSQNDVISVRKEYLTGFLTLYRNNQRCKELFKKSPDHKYVFQSKEHFCFDECNFNFLQLFAGADILELSSEIESMTHVAVRQRNAGKLRVSLTTIALEGIENDILIKKGQVLANNKEFILYHLIDFKKLLYKRLPDWGAIPETYYIHGFYISKHSRKSLAGNIPYLFHNAKRIGLRRKILTKEYFKWCRNYLASSRKIKEADLYESVKLTGTYVLREELTFKVSIHNRKLFLSYKDPDKILLRRQVNGTFLLSRFNEAGYINTCIEFNTEEANAAPTLRIVPSFGHPLNLQKLLD